MVNKAVQKALAALWTDRVTVYQNQKVTDPVTHITDFQEVPILEDQPCKLSFETLAAAEGDPAAAVSQAVKLFLSPDVTVPAGCRVVVTRSIRSNCPRQFGQSLSNSPEDCLTNETERVLTYTSSGLAGMFHNHQEISLVPEGRWA